MIAPSTTPSATPRTKPAMVVASVWMICGHNSGNFVTSVAMICDGRGSTRSDMPVIRQNNSQPTKNSTISPADPAFWRKSMSPMAARSLCHGGALADDEFAQALIERDEIRLEGHGDGAGAREGHPLVVENTAGPRAPHP